MMLPNLNLYQTLVPHSPREEAERQALHTLLRCYCREVATPANEVRLMRVRGAQKARAYLARIELPHSGAVICARVDRRSPVGTADFHELWLQEKRGAPRQKLSWSNFRPLMLQEMTAKLGRAPTPELLELLTQSVDVTEVILRERPQPASSDLSYVQSEQALVFGHPFHPTPKARSGLSATALRAFSPELGTAFALHYFALPPSLMREACLETETASEMVASEGPVQWAPAGWKLIPAHPWQAEYLQTLPLVQSAIKAGQLLYLGSYGPAFSPTASVRTLYSEASRFFYKTSLSFRITNCKRRNAVPEMAGALAISRLMGAAREDLATHFPSFRPLSELGYLSVELPGGDEAASREVSEGFGVMLRQAIDQVEGETPLLTASLFGNEAAGRAQLQKQIGGIEEHETCAWFAAYLEQLVPPMLYLYFERGLMFEPHLQNTVVSCRSGWPVAMYLRDYENGRLVAERLADDAASIDSEILKDLVIDEEKGWIKLAYCLFGNHLVEAVRQLSFDQPALEAKLWALVRSCCEQYLQRFPSPAASKYLGDLLAGAPIPAKTNLLTRFTAGRDAEAVYVSLGNPWLGISATKAPQRLEPHHAGA